MSADRSNVLLATGVLLALGAVGLWAFIDRANEEPATVSSSGEVRELDVDAARSDDGIRSVSRADAEPNPGSGATSVEEPVEPESHGSDSTDPVIAMIEADLASPGSERGCGGLLPSGLMTDDLLERLTQAPDTNPQKKEISEEQAIALRRLLEPVSDQIEHARLEFKFEYARIKLEMIQSGQLETERPELTPENTPVGGRLAGVMSPSGPGQPARYFVINYLEYPLLKEINERAFRLHGERTDTIRAFIDAL